MEKSVNKTMHGIVDYATDKFFSKYSSAKKKMGKMTNRFSSHGSNVMLYSGLALATAGAVFFMVKNRGALVAGITELLNSSGFNITPYRA